MKKRIVVTGLGTVTSIGIGIDAFWNNLIKGKSGISKVESFDTSGHFTHLGGEVKGFKPEEFLNKKRAAMIGRASQLAMAASKLSLKDAGIDLKQIDRSKVAVCMGTTGGESQEIEKMDVIWVKSGHTDVSSRSVIQYPVNNICSNVALELKTEGPTRMFTTACAAGNYAIGCGFDFLNLGEADLIIAGGSDAFSYLAFTGFNQLGAVAPEKCQPFDKNRKGMLVGEGAGVVILETLERAQARKAKIYAEVIGYGLSCDAFHMTNPQVEGVAECMSKALKEAGITSNDVDYICAHGTGTKHNDRTECDAIKSVFGDKKIA
ncbi:MAG: beta-ketoacyl-[acyl-carrier-protein] synthase family protein, partial [Candidatus Omnitrophica bacterium]|nr:beta-ketoacyl-[acyl-carrier-protein] synthase family protein [Candidatus Omnitrophota bacterium]